VLESVPHEDPSASDLHAAEALPRHAAKQQVRKLDAEAPALLKANIESSHWDEVANRCLTCGNCTQVCPTCFCTTTEDTTDLTAARTDRWRRWDSCFTIDYSYIHGGSVRREGGARYRQWITHKLAFWHDQFGVSGCVGCGRCITWCPVGIDITAEVAALKTKQQGG
jgi:ferredoxin